MRFLRSEIISSADSSFCFIVKIYFSLSFTSCMRLPCLSFSTLHYIYSSIIRCCAALSFLFFSSKSDVIFLINSFWPSCFCLNMIPFLSEFTKSNYFFLISIVNVLFCSSNCTSLSSFSLRSCSRFDFYNIYVRILFLIDSKSILSSSFLLSTYG